MSSHTPAARTGTFAQNGEFWTIAYGGDSFSLKDVKGLTYLQFLLQHPNEEFHAMDLVRGPGMRTLPDGSAMEAVAPSNGLSLGGVGDAGEMLDAQAKREYRRQLGELRADLAELRERGDAVRGEAVEAEIDFIERELVRAVGLGGRDRRAGSAAERARLNVTRAIRAATKRISEHHAALGQLLESCIRTGSFCSYIPNPRVPIAWQFTLDDGEPVATTGTTALVLLSRDTGLIEPLAYRTTFVGREDERAVIRRYLAQAQNGEGRVVIVGGPPGIGKTRIARETGEEARRRGFVALAGNCYDREDSVPFVPFVELIEVALARASSPAAVDELLGEQAAELTRLLPQLRRLLPDLPTPLPLSPEQSRRLLFNAVVELLARQSALRPLLLLLEDLHWADEGTLALLVHLGRSIARLPVLIIATHRDDDIDMKPPLTIALDELTRLRVVERIELHGLPQGAVAEMIEDISRRPPAPALVELIYSDTDGNPLFVEELIRQLGSSPSNHDWLERGAQVELDLPHSLRLVIGRRLGLVSRETARILDTAAVIGRSFPFALLEAATHSDSDRLLDSVEEAEKAGLISSKLRYPEVRFEFAHELFRRAVLDEISIARRQRLHLNIAEAFELLHPNDLEAHAEDLAYHFWSAGAAAEPGRAIGYLQMAGEKAARSSAFKEAQQSYEQALALLSLLPDSAERDRREIAIRTGLVESTQVMSGYAAPEYENHLTRRHELAQRLGDTTQIFYSLVGISVLSALRLELSKAREIGWKLLALADRELDPGMQLRAHGSLANILWLMGDVLGSREHSEKGIALFARDEHLPSGHEHVRATCLFYAANSTAALGFPDEGLRRSLEFLTWARERVLPLPLVFALNCVATIFAWRREGGEALKYADALLALTAEHGFTNWHSFTQIARGQALALLGKTDEAIAQIKSGLATLEVTGAAVPGWVHSALAFAYLAAQQPAEGLIVAAKALQVADQTGDGEAQPELHRLKGELLLMRDPSATAEGEASFRAAINAARKQYARLSELRATTSLARLLRDTGRRKEARTMLAGIYRWFTEGFDTADLKDAKALLEELTS